MLYIIFSFLLFAAFNVHREEKRVFNKENEYEKWRSTWEK